MKAIFSFLLASTFCVMGCDSKTEIAPQDDIIRLEFESDTSNLAADNSSIIAIKAIIPEKSAAAYRNITFVMSSADLGTFQSTSADGKPVVPAGDEGIGRMNLKIGAVPGTYYVSAMVSNGTTSYKSKDYPITLREIAGSQKLVVTVDNTKPEADGYSTFKIHVKRYIVTDKTAALKVNLGTLLQSTDGKNITLNFDANGEAFTEYKMSNELMPHIFTVSLASGYTNTFILEPQVSRPDILFAETDVLTVDTMGGNVKITAFLKKENVNKKVSKNTRAYFFAYQEASGVKKEVGRFTGLTDAVSDENGKLPVVSFFADTGGIDTTKNIQLVVKTLKTAIDTISTVQVIKLKK